MVRNGQADTVFSQDIQTGDIVIVNNNRHFPADLVIIASSQEDGSCYVETANLDGYVINSISVVIFDDSETNLKARKSLDVTAPYKTVQEVSMFQGNKQFISRIPNALFRSN